MSLVDADAEKVLSLHQGSLANGEDHELVFSGGVPAGGHSGVASGFNSIFAQAQTLDLLTVEINHGAVIDSNSPGVEPGGGRIIDLEFEPEIGCGEFLFFVVSVAELRYHIVFAVAKRRLADLPFGIVKICPGPLFRGSLPGVEVAPSLLALRHQPRPPRGGTLCLALTLLSLRAFSLFAALLREANGGGQDSCYQRHGDGFHL